MKKCVVCFYVVMLLTFAFCLSSCSKTDSVAEIPDNTEEQGLIGVYTTDTDKADVYVYNFFKEDGVSLEKFGQQQAAEHNVFCNMMTDRNVPVAVLNYHESVEDEHYIVQAYIYDFGTNFIEVRTMFKTEPVSFGSGNLSIRMIREYDAQEKNDSPLIFETVHLTENDRLPMLRIRQFSKNDFPAEFIEPELLNAVSDGQYSAFAENGWTLEEIISLYDESYDLLRGDVTCRNNLNLAFIGYIDDGVFKTRAVIDDGTDYVMLCAEAEVSRFQHVTNALIDAIERKNL